MRRIITRHLALFYLLLISTPILLMTSCEDDIPPEIKETYALQVSPSNHTFDTEGGDLIITVKSTKTITTKTSDKILSDVEDVPFTVDISEDWLLFVPEEGILRADNNDGEQRTAVVTFSMQGSDLKREIKLTQKGKEPEPDPLVRYVSPSSKGNGNGNTIENAADFLDPLFWLKISSEIALTPVEVKFEAGDYVRAFSEGGLIFTGEGNEKNRLTLSGNDGVIFNLPLGHPDKVDVLRFNDCQNIHIKDFHFTGDGVTQYTLRITGAKTNNLLIEGCSWINMNGIIYGATGCHNGAKNVTYRDCYFKKIGPSGGTHMMYHSYKPSNIGVFDCHFEDCMGDYVRFRAGTEYGIVKNCTFIRNQGYPDVLFIAMPCFNDVNPGDESFGTNFSFTGNSFENKASTNSTKPIGFYHQGFSPKEHRYLLTKAEGDLLTNGREADKIRILKDNFGIDVNRIRIQDNVFSSKITNLITIRSSIGYGAVSLGWQGTAVITDLIKPGKEPFEWELDWKP